MTRIYTFGLDKETEEGGSYYVILVAHKDSKRAARVALAEANKEGGAWKIVHKAERRTGERIPAGEILGATGPFAYTLDGE